MQRRYLLLGLAGVLALSLALPAVGAPSPVSVAKKALKVAKKADKRSKKALKRAKRGATGPQGQQGQQGVPGSALGYAYVNSDGTVDESRSKNLTDANVTEAAGIYGFHGLPFTPQNIVTTVAFDSASVTGSNADYNSLGFIGDCSFIGGTDQACATTNTDTDADPEPHDFFVLFN